MAGSRPPRVYLYQASGCGGCEVALLDLQERFFAAAEQLDLCFWPMVMDSKYQQLEDLPDSEGVCLLMGAVRTAHDERTVRLLRRKSRSLVATGACALSGGVTGLADLHLLDHTLARVFKSTPSTQNDPGVIPGGHDLPPLCSGVRSVDQVVEVDHRVPGCPPATHQLERVIDAVVEQRLPAPGGLLGAGDRCVCDECRLPQEARQVARWTRPHQGQTTPDRCLLEQGLICLGPVTRSGCGARCMDALAPCRGCYGPVPGTDDLGARMIATLATLLRVDDDRCIGATPDQIVDPVGTFYRFALSTSPLRRWTPGGEE